MCEGYWLDCPIAVAARKLIVQFCSLTGTIFPSGTVVSCSTCSITVACFRFSYMNNDEINTMECARCLSILFKIMNACVVHFSRILLL